jgi:hypothetical protein
MANQRAIMGERTNSRALNGLDWMAVGVMAAALGLMGTWIAS